MTDPLSLGEVETLARLAARGGGLPCGMADEAGRAVRALCAVGLDGCAALAALLGAMRTRRARRLAPQRLEDRVWAGAQGVLCPIGTGAALSDIARSLPPDGVGLMGVLQPVLLLPFAADVARLRQEPVTLSWRDGIVSIGPEGLAQDTGFGKLAKTRVAGLHLHPGGPAPPATRPHTRANPSPTTRAALLAEARRTTRPAG